MLYYDKFDVFEETNVNKRSKSRECDICHYWCKRFKFQPHVCNRCHDLLMMSMNLKAIAILNIKGADYCFIISGISKSETIKLIGNINLAKKKWNIMKLI